MNKYVKIIIILIFLVILGFFGYSVLNPNIENMSFELVNDKTEISKIVTDSFLDILVETKNYSNKDINYEDMLKASMRIARELNLFEEMSDENTFYEYVPEDTIHEMISELTGKKVEDPIRIEDFYYLYNEEENYYYVVPVGTDWIHIEEIKEVRKIKNGEYYLITCSTSFSDDGLAFYDSGDVKIILKHCTDNKYIRYQLVSMEYTKGTLEEI